jgi:UDPglucose--hexose-1-phosphate uridylyltransferase
MKPQSEPHRKHKAEPQTFPSEIRKHYFLDRYVVIAPKRNLRPDSFAKANSPHKLETVTSPPIEKDPPVAEYKRPDGSWMVKVVKNAFPALSLDSDMAYGKQEVVIETPEHNVEFSELPIEHILAIFETYKQRVEQLHKVPDIRYVVVFKNDGPSAGASIAHAHSQIIALPFIPPTVEDEAAASDKYTREYGSCPLCDAITMELKQKIRIIFEDKNIIALSPYAVREPFGVWILPKRHIPNFRELKHSELQSIAVIMKKLTAKLDSMNISFNFFLQDSLPGENQHFIIKIEPRPNTWGGFELSTGVIINPVSPEYAALWYNDKVS